MPISRLATESRPSQAQCSSWQLPLNGRAVPALPCAGKLPPQRPPVLYHRACAIPARRRRASHVDAPLRARFQIAADAPVVSTPPCVRGSRSSNHESRVTNHGSYGRSGPPLCGETPLAPPPCVIPPCVRDSSLPPTRQSCRRAPACAIPARRRRANRVNATVRARLPQFESRITSHESRLCYTTVPARFQLAADAPVMSTRPCLRDSSSPSTRPCVRGSRSSNHESRVTNHACVIPPCLRVPSSPPTRHSCRRPPACAIPARRRRHHACAAPAVRITNHESRITPVLYHRTCASPTRSQFDPRPPLPPGTGH